MVLVVTNPVDALTRAALEHTGFSPQRVLGSGTVLDSLRLRFMLSEHTGVDAASIHAYVLGEHGDSELPAWSTVSIAAGANLWAAIIYGEVRRMDGRCWIVGAGDWCAEGWSPLAGDLVIAADGGQAPLSQLGTRADVVVGDFDSLREAPRGGEIVRLPAEKDDTDMVAALRLGLARGYRGTWLPERGWWAVCCACTCWKWWLEKGRCAWQVHRSSSPARA